MSGSPRRSSWRSAGRTAVGVVVVAALVVVVVREREALARGLDMSPAVFATIAGFSIATWVLGSIVQVEMLRALSAPISWWRMLALHIASGLLNYVPAKPGTLFRAGYLKQSSGLAYAHFGSVALVNVLVVMASSGLTGAAAIAWGYGLADLPRQGLFAAFVALAVAGAVPLVYAPRFGRAGRWQKIWNSLVDGRDRIRAHPGLLAVIFACHMLSFVFSAVRFMAAFHSLGIDIGFVGCLVLGAVGRLSIFFAITPGGVGVQELVVAACAGLLGVSFTITAVAGTVVRAVLIVCYVALGVPALLALRRGESRVPAGAPRPGGDADRA